MKFISKLPSIDFIRNRIVAFVVSCAFIMAGIVSLVIHQGPNYGIDFSGGTLIHLKTTPPLSTNDLRRTMDTMDLGSYVIQDFGEKSHGEMLVRLAQSSPELKGLGEKVVETLQQEFADHSIELRRVEMVGPQVGKDLREKGILAICYAMLGMLIYIAWRFELKFAVAAVVALLHDIMITVGIFSIADKEISLSVVAALLTIAGYSINDTIVVFDRFRENLRLMRKKEYKEILNISINQTLSRTMLTSLTTLMVTLILLVIGGDVIHDFAFALTVGVLVGTYSSIFVASPIVYTWHNIAQARR